MEKGLRECCKSMRIGKILVTTDEDTGVANVCYLKLPADIGKRKVLLLYPIIKSGDTCVKAIEKLLENHVTESNILLLNLFATHEGVCLLYSSNSMYPRGFKKSPVKLPKFAENCPQICAKFR